MRLMTLLIPMVLVLGCRKSSPVNEISIAASGVEIKEVEPLADLTRSWPAWRGPTGDGIAIDQQAPTTWSESEGVVWMSDVPGRGHGSPTVVGNQVLLATALDSEQQQLVLAYDRETGEELWSTVVHAGNFPSKREIHNKGSNANSTLACDGKLAFIAFFNGGKVTATALDLDGNIVWQQELGAFSSKFGFAPSPVLYKSFVIFAVDNWGGGYIAAVEADSGKIAWKTARDAKNSHSSPLIANVGGQDQLLICGLNTVDSYDPATGERRWSTAGTAETTCGTMVVAGDKVVASGGFPETQTICLSATGDKLWENGINVYEPSILAVGDAIFAVSDKGIAYCWSAEDGHELWKKRLGGSFSASPIVCSGNIYVSDLSGKTYVFKASPESYQEIAVNQLGADCYASPAVVGNQIFLRVGFGSGEQRREKLVCIGD